MTNMETMKEIIRRKQKDQRERHREAMLQEKADQDRRVQDLIDREQLQLRAMATKCDACGHPMQYHIEPSFSGRSDEPHFVGKCQVKPFSYDPVTQQIPPPCTCLQFAGNEAWVRQTNKAWVAFIDKWFA